MDIQNQERLIKEMKEGFEKAVGIVAAKNHDYAKVVDPFINFKLQATLSGDTVEGAFLHEMGRKFARILNLVRDNKTNAVSDETVEDTLLDLANYAILFKIFREWHKEELQHTEATKDKGLYKATSDGINGKLISLKINGKKIPTKDLQGYIAHQGDKIEQTVVFENLQ